ncbi:MAG TPA: penicillin-binding protein 2 [Nitrolancea sp.]|nr:penicillin-binding protein 2 [Nitrolancea sp.]
MSVIGLVVVVGGLFLLADRFGGSLTGTNTIAGTPAAGSPKPVDVSRLRSPRDAAQAWADLWTAGNYAGMYEILSTPAKQRITPDDFVKRYQGIDQEAGQTGIRVTPGEAPKDSASIPIHISRDSAKAGTLEEDNTIPTVKEGSVYRVDWTPSLIFADLGDGFVRWVPNVPPRGRILDRKGRPLANLGMISKVGVIPGQITDEPAMLEKLSQLLQMPPDAIKSKYANGQPDWFMPIRNFPDQMDPAILNELNGLPGVSVQKFPDRVYPAGPVAAHVVGYLSQVTAEELPELSKKGYASGDVIGRSGIEAWGEKYLGGKRGGRLVIVGADGAERKTLAEVKSEQAADITLTIDLDVQTAADKALGDKTGAVVVLDPTTGAVLAMVSHPTFDPNQFILGQTDESWAKLNDAQAQPLQNRATQFGYPTGSTFKVVTATAGMESLGLTTGSTIPCPASFSLPGSNQTWHDWNPNGQGTLTLHNALVQSCNTVFYQIGTDLDKKDPTILPNTTRGFGFGSPTGLPELPEIAGTVPDPDWKLKNVNDHWARGDAVNLAIGQGFFLATPLQLADAYAAIANGGTLWQPYLVQEVTALDGSKPYVAQPKERGKLPATPEHLAAIRAALKDVISAPNGTAGQPYSGVTHPVAGKTGTAESSQANPHSWFAAFSPVDGARLAEVAMVEHGGEGSQAAAPVTRQVIDAFYAANP